MKLPWERNFLIQFPFYFSQAGTLTVEDLIRQLKAFKNSNNSRDQKVLNCVVKNLFEEYRFFHEYPDRELKTTAEMYGGIIREGIIRWALKYPEMKIEPAVTHIENIRSNLLISELGKNWAKSFVRTTYLLWARVEKMFAFQVRQFARHQCPKRERME